jgi:predicted PurR-regulated permease PerM
MSKKKKKQGGGGQPRLPSPSTLPQLPAPVPDAGDTRALPATLKKALKADYSEVLRIRNVQWLIVIAVVAGALILGYYLSAVFVPLLVALAIAYILNPLVVKLQKKGLSRTKSVLLIFLLFIVAAAGIGTWFATSVVSDVRSMGDELGRLIDKVEEDQDEWLASWNESVPESARIDPDQVTLDAVYDVARERLLPSQSAIDTPEEAMARADMVAARSGLLTNFQQLDQDRNFVLTAGELDPEEFALADTDSDGRIVTQEWFARFGAPIPQQDARAVAPEARVAAEGIFSAVSSGVVTLFTFLLFITLVPLYTWYFMVGFDKFVAKGQEYLPGAHRPRIEKILKEIDAMLKAFFRGRIVIVVVIVVLTTIVYLVFGVRYAVLLGLMAGVGVLIPYASMVLSWIPAMIIMAITGQGWVSILLMSVFFHVVQAFEQYVLTPKMLGDAVELHPVTLLVGVFVMGSLFGIFGALLAVPLTAIAKTLGREFLLPYFKSLANEKPRTAES